MRPARVVVILALAVLVTVGILSLAGDPDEVVEVTVAPPAPPPASPIAAVPATSAATVALPTPSSSVVSHTLDPCEPIRAPDLPPAFEVRAFDGITIAWDPAIDLEPAPLAYLTKGLLVQAGLETGTSPRDQLALVVYASADEFRDQTHAPRWAGGLYDGAVRIPASEHADLGVALEALRHEVMHAQLHAGVGCMAAWLDEGVAQYFAHEVPETPWLSMLGGRAKPSLVRLQVASIQDAVEDSPPLAYAQSYAMVLFAIGRGQSVHEMIRQTRRLGPRAPTTLWTVLFPGVED
ncbi:MAG: hypothetical protein ABI678_29020, partial [Kofleriaceae bacterium]